MKLGFALTKVKKFNLGQALASLGWIW